MENISTQIKERTPSMKNSPSFNPIIISFFVFTFFSRKSVISLPSQLLQSSKAWLSICRNSAFYSQSFNKFPSQGSECKVGRHFLKDKSLATFFFDFSSLWVFLWTSQILIRKSRKKDGIVMWNIVIKTLLPRSYCNLDHFLWWTSIDLDGHFELSPQGTTTKLSKRPRNERGNGNRKVGYFLFLQGEKYSKKKFVKKKRGERKPHGTHQRH